MSDYVPSHSTDISKTFAKARAELLPEHEKAALDQFTQAMSDKLYKKHLEGRGGFENCHPDLLSKMLRDHVEKGDPVDVANFCMMLHYLGARIK